MVQLYRIVKKKALTYDAHVVAEPEQPSHSETDVLSFIPPLQTKTGLSCFRVYVSFTSEVRTYPQSTDHIPASSKTPKRLAGPKQN